LTDFAIADIDLLDVQLVALGMYLDIDDLANSEVKLTDIGDFYLCYFRCCLLLLV